MRQDKIRAPVPFSSYNMGDMVEEKLIIKNARLFDPAVPGLEWKPGDILVLNGKIAVIGESLSADGETIDANGLYVFPGFCDPHAHFRTPGQEEKEDLESGSRAAVAGGYTSVIQMPNTAPSVDSLELVRILTKTEPIEIRAMGAVTKGLAGKEITDWNALIDAGAVGLSDDGQPVFDPEIMTKALLFSKNRKVPVSNHSEDKSIGEQGAVRATWDPSREWSMVERDIAIAKETGGHLHVCHVSTRQSVDLIRKAKRDGLNVTAEATPHHLTLITDIVKKLGADAKMNPPLGDEEDREALIQALADGTIDCIATDHAPHTRDEKSLGLKEAPFGVVGLETSFAVCYTKLVKTGRIELSRLIAAMSHIPRKIFNLEPVGLFAGSRADLSLIDLDREWIIDPEMFQSKGRSSPFTGKFVTGKVLMTISRGQIRWRVDC